MTGRVYQSMEAFSHADWCLAQAIHWELFGGVGVLGTSEGQGFWGWMSTTFFFPPCVATPEKFWNSLDFTRCFFKIGTYFSATLGGCEKEVLEFVSLQLFGVAKHRYTAGFHSKFYDSSTLEFRCTSTERIALWLFVTYPRYGP